MFYIHLPDPGFPDPPYPMERRLGPYLTLEEAISQAVSDCALGFGTPVGIYQEEESAKREAGRLDEAGTLVPGRSGKAAYSASQIEARALTMRKRLQAQAVAAAQEQEEMLRKLLPEGVSWEDLQALATSQRQAALARIQEDAP